ncbi:LOW QUALITY PROTEIN: hypothetical protein CRUP_006799 [Coryphaenoides rupestris]|nr:LOW QUALITY PROTEIN: hypothetical protein CRUP_006799 [Coryphaenoides rupestris]
MGKEDEFSTLRKVNVLKIQHADDPIRNFEKWKKKYQKTKIRVKKERNQRKKPDWQVEREQIDTLVSRYHQINAKDAIKFSDFPISKKTLRGLLEGQYRQPTEIQRQTIGFALQGKDVLGAAKTGSGKTLAFLVPVLESLYRHQWTAMDGLGALIISPTRELAYQTFEVLRKIGKNHEFSAGLIIGGKDLKSESERIHRTNIVICTPGRLLQHLDETATFHVSDLHMLVLDEADRILDLGFADTLNAIVENLPKTRQTLLFSATQTKSVKELARLSLKDPEYVWVHEKAMFSTPATLEQSFVVCELHQKVNMLYSFIRSHLQKKVIVFFACCKEVQYLFRTFCRLRMPILALHGKQQQMKRMEVYKDFVGKKSAVLFATDIAARGLDFPAVNWVLQFDCPEDADTYIHRVGRTARYKEGGEALLVLLPSEEEGMVAQLKDKKVPINKIQVNPDKLQNVQLKLEAFLAQEMEQKERAQRCFVSYLRSVYLMKNKKVFDVLQINIHDYALSLGLAVAPRVRFLNKAQVHKKEQGQAAPEQSEDVDLQQFKAKLCGKAPSSTEPQQTEPEEDEDESTAAALFVGVAGHDEGDDDDLREVDLLTVKRRDVFSLSEDQEGVGDEELDMPKGKKLTTLSEAKKILKRKFKVNTKITFSEEGDLVQQWPLVQRSAVQAADEELEEEFAGINVEKARERLKREDQEFDKQEYNRKIKERKREKRLKAKAARREASKRSTDKSDEEEEEEEETVAYLDHSGEEFDPSTLPDPDKPQTNLKPSTDASINTSGESSCEDDDSSPANKRKRLAHHQPLDTGLSLAEDEELVLRLLGSS